MLKVNLPKGNREKNKPVIPSQPNIRSRIIWTWASVMLGLILYAFFWFITGLVLMPIIDIVVASYNFPSSWTSVVTLIRNVILYHPIIAMFGFILWGILNSSRRDTPTWEG